MLYAWCKEAPKDWRYSLPKYKIYYNYAMVYTLTISAWGLWLQVKFCMDKGNETPVVALIQNCYIIAIVACMEV